MATTECPDCGYESSSERGLKIHYSKAHAPPGGADEFPWDATDSGATLTCDWCGDDYYERAGRVDRSRFCSRDCLAEWQSEEFKDSNRAIPREGLLEELRRLAREVGGPPPQAEMQQRGQHSIDPYQREFGSWPAALRAAGLDPDNRETECPECGTSCASGKGLTIHRTKVHGENRPGLLDALRELAQGQERPPSKEQMADEGPYSTDVYYNVYGSWPAALEAAGLGRNPYDYDRLSTDELLAEFHRLADALGHRPRQEDMRQQGRYSQRVYQTRFGSWSAAVEAAGFDPSIYGWNRIPESTLLDDLRRVAAELGHAPTVPQYREYSEYHDATFHARFGSWIDAQRAAGLEPTRRRPGNGKPDHAYRGAWEVAREAALHRDQYRCQDCGVTDPAYREQYSRGLDVHHIVAYDDFEDPADAHVLGNLVTVCRACHGRRHAAD